LYGAGWEFVLEGEDFGEIYFGASSGREEKNTEETHCEVFVGTLESSLSVARYVDCSCILVVLEDESVTSYNTNIRVFRKQNNRKEGEAQKKQKLTASLPVQLRHCRDWTTSTLIRIRLHADTHVLPKSHQTGGRGQTQQGPYAGRTRCSLNEGLQSQKCDKRTHVS
jgi:hypothetical protein